MSHLRKWASVLAAFSLAVTLLTGLPAQASSLAPESETIEDPEADAAALGSANAEEGAASGGAQEDGAEEEDVMATVSGEANPETDSGDTTAGGGSGSGAFGAGGTSNDSGDTAADAGATSDSGASGDGATTDNGASEDGATSEEEAAAEGETPVEEETASSGVKEDEAEGQKTPDENESALPFADVPPTHWSYPIVLYAYEHNLVRGVSETSFNPTGVMTRAAFVTVLYRFSRTIDADMSGGENAFTDIDHINAEFQSAVLWAAAHGIVTGRADATFAPAENVTRQQMCAILVRYLRDYLRYDLSAYVGADIFADSDAISAYAKEAVSIAQGMDIISGREVDGVTVFDPAGSASRAAVVKVLSIAVQKIPDLSKLPEEEAPPVPDDGASDTGDSVDTGDSADTGDSEKTSSGDSSSGGGSSSGSGGSSSGGSSSGSGSSSGGSSSSSGGSSGGGSSSSSGGSSGGGSSSGSGGSLAPTGPSPDEPAEAAEIFGYIDEMLSAYEANPPADETTQGYLDIIIPDFRAMTEARNKGVIVDAAYFKAHYSSDVDKLLEKFSENRLEDSMKAADYVRTVISTSDKLSKIQSYFDLRDIMLEE